MTFKFNQIDNLSAVSIDEIDGTLQGRNRVIVKRKRHGWDVHLVITVNGYTFHDAPASEEERTEFGKLWERAVAWGDEVRSRQRAAAMSVARVSLV